jgi:hypothetical protein
MANKKYRDSHPEKVREWKRSAYRRERTNHPERLMIRVSRRRKKVKAFIAAYKLQRGCVDCGYKQHHVALAFDHVEGTKLSSVARCFTMTSALREISKCVIRCHNCHSIVTFKRLHGDVTRSA